MKNSSIIAIQLFMIQCFWSLQSHPEKITTIYCHGVGGNSSQVNDYKDLVQKPYKAVEFPDAQIPKGFNTNRFIYYLCDIVWNKKHINRQNMFMGQGKDIETIREQINPEEHYILFGLCRGAAAIVNYIALYNPTNITALVLDEMPANMFDIVEKIMFMDKNGKKIRSSPIQYERWFRWCFPVYPKGSKNTVSTIPYIKNKELPIFMSYANKDTTFHFPSSAWKNYLALKKAGFKNVYLCQLQHHGQQAEGNDRKVYLESLHSFYKKYGLPYEEKYAILSDEELLKLQPSTEEITKILHEYIKKITPEKKAFPVKYAQTRKQCL